MLRALTEKVNNMQEDMVNVSRDMECLRIRSKYHQSEIQRNQEWLSWSHQQTGHDWEENPGD